MRKPIIKIESNIPYIKGRLEGKAEVEYLSPEDFTAEAVRDADAIVVRTRTHCNSKLLDSSNVKLVVTATIGTDHIDIPYCENRGIKVCNAPGCNAPGVAQYVWSALLRLGFRPGIDKLGVVGYGNVGTIVADWGKRLGTEVLVNDPPKTRLLRDTDSPLTAELKNKGMKEASLEDILRECDAVTLHTPLTEEGEDATFHLIGEHELSMMKSGAILVNAARGPVVDSQALKKALDVGRLRGVLDTWEGEPQLDKKLLSLTSIATPHIAGYSRQGKERATRMSIEAINEFFGIKGDTSGLTGIYLPPATLSEEDIKASYDPYIDDCNLRNNPGAFEQLRKDHHYREETGEKSN